MNMEQCFKRAGLKRARTNLALCYLNRAVIIVNPFSPKNAVRLVLLGNKLDNIAKMFYFNGFCLFVHV
jgi:hypothetical protein